MSNTIKKKAEVGPQQAESELLPCPFCGAQPVTQKFDDEELSAHIVTCTNDDCPANPVTSGDTPEDAAELWNIRNGGAA